MYGAKTRFQLHVWVTLQKTLLSRCFLSYHQRKGNFVFVIKRDSNMWKDLSFSPCMMKPCQVFFNKKHSSKKGKGGIRNED
jgi:hypothetical protein